MAGPETYSTEESRQEARAEREYAKPVKFVWGSFQTKEFLECLAAFWAGFKNHKGETTPLARLLLYELEVFPAAIALEALKKLKRDESSTRTPPVSAIIQSARELYSGFKATQSPAISPEDEDKSPIMNPREFAEYDKYWDSRIGDGAASQETRDFFIRTRARLRKGLMPQVELKSVETEKPAGPQDWAPWDEPGYDPEAV